VRVVLRLGEIEQDVAAETGGVWRESPWGGEFLIGRAGNREYRREVRRLVEALRDAIGKRDLTAEEWADVHVQATAKCVLRGWRDIEGADGQALAYSQAAAVELLRNEAFADLADWIMARAQEVDAYRKRAQKDAEGNSGALSAGS